MGEQRTALLLLLILSAMLFSFTEIKITKAANTDIFIRADGSIEGTDKIQRDGDVYTFTGDIYSRIEIQRSNIILDGAGYSIIKSERDFAIVVGTRLDVPEPVGVNGITIMNLHIIGFNYGITLSGENNLVQKVNITDSQSYNGIPIWVSGSNHRIQKCRITDNKGFGMLIHATDTLISDNYIANNGAFGIEFYDHDATFRNNIFDNNWRGPFLIPERSMKNPGEPLAISSDNIDSSNTVDGKPVYYWVNECDKTVPLDAGYVYLDNCRNIEVKNLSINRNSTGRFSHGSTAINLIRTENSTISSNSLNGTGIYISWSSQNILVSNNKITSAGVHSWGSNIAIVENSISSINDIGISLGGSSNEVAWNNLTRCKTGIDFQSSKNNVTQNNIVNCDKGINLFSSNENDFYHNNFINNTQHVYDQHYTLQWPLEAYYQSYNNTWDRNYWSDYEGTDLDGDGLGDIPYIINDEHQDNYPLMNPVDIEVATVLFFQPPEIYLSSPENSTYTVNCVSLNFTVNEVTTWMGYSLDGQNNITITKNTLNIAELADGSHSLTVYTTDTSGDTGKSETIWFTIDTFSIICVIGIILIIALGIASFMAYFLKVKKTRMRARVCVNKSK